jgi:hypothetical protein
LDSERVLKPSAALEANEYFLFCPKSTGLEHYPKPYGSRGTVNDAVVQGQFTVLSGEVCQDAVLRAMEV